MHPKGFGEMAQGNLGTEAVETIMSFTSRMYGAKANQTHSLNTQHFKVFEKTYAPKATAKNPLEKLKGIDASMIPPCEAEVTQQIKRATFVAKMWADSHEKMIQQQPSKDDGWELKENVYEILWFDGPQMPETLVPDESSFETGAEDDDSLLLELKPSSSDEESMPSSDE